MSRRLSQLALTATLMVASSAQGQLGGQETCWCYVWVHGPDHGTDCFRVQSRCESDRRARGNSGETRACERDAGHAQCGRVGFHEGRAVNLGPTRPGASRLLGMSSAELRRALGPPTGREDGWRRYGANVAVRLRSGRVIRARVRVADGLSCQDAVRREGFSSPGAPIRGSACRWPGASPRHRLESSGRIAGRLEPDTATLEIWYR